MSLTSLDHAIVLVRDLRAAVAGYRRLLGREPSWLGAHPAFGTRNALFALPHAALELLAPEADAPVARALAARIEGSGEGLFALAFATADAERACARLRANGLPAADPVDGEGVARSGGAVRRFRNVYLPPDATRGVTLFAIERLSPQVSLPVPPPGDAAAAVADLDHVVILSRDLEASRRLYQDALGLRLALDRRFPEYGTRLLFFRVGGATLEVGGRFDAEATGGEPDRLWGLAWSVPSLDAARGRLVALGLDVSETRPGRKPGTRVCTVRSDTCAVPTLLIEPAARRRRPQVGGGAGGGG